MLCRIDSFAWLVVTCWCNQYNVPWSFDSFRLDLAVYRYMLLVYCLMILDNNKNLHISYLILAIVWSFTTFVSQFHVLICAELSLFFSYIYGLRISYVNKGYEWSHTVWFIFCRFFVFLFNGLTYRCQ